MAIDLRLLGAGAILLAVCTVILCGCGCVSPPPAEARTDAFVITEDEMSLWAPFLSEKRELRDRLRKAEDHRLELLRIMALVRLVPLDHRDLIPEDDLEAGRRNLEARQVRAAYIDAVLRPQVSIDPSEVRKIFDDHRQNFQKPEAVRVLEIYRWAPEDLPDLRAERRAELSRLRPLVAGRDDFERLALEHSDATSAYKGGRIGILRRDEVEGNLESVLFSGGLGLTGVVESKRGVHLFFIIDRLPPRNSAFEAVAEGIERTLKRRRLQLLIRHDAERLVGQHRLTLVPATETGDGRPRLRIDDQELTAGDLGLPLDLAAEALEDRMTQRGVIWLYRRELVRRGVSPDPVDSRDLLWLRYRLAWRRLVADELAKSPPGTRPPDPSRQQPTIERWTFDLLRLPADGGTMTWDAAFRASLAVGPDAGLESLGTYLQEHYGLEGRVESFRDVTGREAGPLGPEIHTTIKKLLTDGERSHPLVLEDRNEVVVIHLRTKRVDPEASASAAERRDRRLHRREVERRLENAILNRHRFEVS
jgi:hypothetical protein